MNLLLGLLFLNITSQSIALLLNTLLSSLTGSLGLRTLGVHLLLENSLTLLLGLSLVDLQTVSVELFMLACFCLTYVFNQSTLVLEGVTLAELVQLVVEVLIDLASGTVLDQKTTEDTEASHPENLTKGRTH
jgi:hypothetical protein